MGKGIEEHITQGTKTLETEITAKNLETSGHNRMTDLHTDLQIWDFVKNKHRNTWTRLETR